MGMFDSFEDFQKSIGVFLFKIVILAIGLITYVSKQHVLLNFLDGDLHKLGFVEGIGFMFLIYGQFSKSSKSIYYFFKAIKNLIEEKNDLDR
jgi:hypothetical protein